MAGTNLEFDFGKAKELEGVFIKEVDTIKTTLDGIQTQKVEPVREWWKGGSEESFIKNFERTKKDVMKSLQKWLEEYKKLIQDVAKVKEQQEKEVQKALNK